MAATQTSPQQQQETHQTFESLKPGDRIEATHVITIGPQTWTTKSVRHGRPHGTRAARPALPPQLR